MKEIIKKECMDITTNAVKLDNIKITLEQWPCTVAILGVCATYAFVTWLNQSASGTTKSNLKTEAS